MQLANNVKRLAAVPGFYKCQPGTEADRKIKVQNIFNCSSAFGQPELLLISEQNADTAFRLSA